MQNVIVAAGAPALGDRLAWKPGGEVRLTGRAAAAMASFQRKVADGSYAFEDQPCFCGSAEGLLLSTVDRYGFLYPLVACGRCGLLRSQPRLTAESYRAFYDAEYRTLYGDDDADLEVRLQNWLAQGREAFRYVAGQGEPRGIVLDIGCNTGVQLLPFKEAGCEVYGVDYGSRYLEYGRQKHGLTGLMHGGVEKFLALGKKADIVIMSHVFEHMLNLEAELAKVREAMAPDGLLYIAVPGTYWWINRSCGGNVLYLLQNAHTYQFSLASLTYVLECCGFRRAAGNEEIRALFRPAPARRARGDVPEGEADKVVGYLRATEAKYLRLRAAGVWLDRLGLKRAAVGIWNRIQKARASARAPEIDDRRKR